MSMTWDPWEPPRAGDEIAHLTGALDRLRTTFRWKADGLGAEGLALRTGRSTLTLGGLLKHLAVCEDMMLTFKLDGSAPGDPWDEHCEDPFGWALESAADDEPGELYALYDGAVARSHARLAAALADGGLDRVTFQSRFAGEDVSLRRLLFDLVEEYGRHTGHADLLRESVDGRVGEDPPSGWRPVSAPGAPALFGG
ncbi:DUF664 domain-containing protein [Sanguibacter sp. HDW7]|uniref:mycothiol transferase n=1 Tax=Sanguibacter sp. HDW7 TaxID=2714931 RepID=UPI001F107E56|nr:DUF664 domain-containing protein [Sanguibacter sp. HDW7]